MKNRHFLAAVSPPTPEPRLLEDVSVTVIVSPVYSNELTNIIFGNN
jgi:hypothetical protein